MLSLEEIKEKTIWVAHLYGGTRFTGTYKELEHWKDSEDLDELDTVCAEGQPKELQPFWQAYEYANYKLQRHDLYIIDDFYAEWSKNPNQFVPELKLVIGNLRDKLESISKEESNIDIIIVNYDETPIGNHKINCWIKTLNEMNTNFDIISIRDDFNAYRITIQETDKDKIEKLDIISNSLARVY